MDPNASANTVPATAGAQPAEANQTEQPSEQENVQIEPQSLSNGPGPPPPHTTTTPTEYTPTFLVQAYDVTLNYISSELGNHIYHVLQEMRKDAETYGKKHNEKPKRILAQLLEEVHDWRHIPVAKGDSATILDQEVDAVRRGVPNMMNAVEDAMRTGAIFLSGGRGASAEGVTVKVPPIRDFVNEVFVRVAKEYSGRNGPARLYRHLTMNKDKLIAEVKHAASVALFPRDTLWGSPDEVEKTISIPPPGQADALLQPPRQKTISLGQQDTTPEPSSRSTKDGDEFQDDDPEMAEGGESDSGDDF